MSDDIDPLAQMRADERKLSEAISRKAMASAALDLPIDEQDHAALDALNYVRRRIREEEQKTKEAARLEKERRK